MKCFAAKAARIVRLYSFVHVIVPGINSFAIAGLAAVRRLEQGHSLADPAPENKALPINLPTALRLANVRPIDVAVAEQRIQLALSQLQQARVLWLPTIFLGTDYFPYDGQLQDVQGNVFGTSKTSFLLGAGPYAVFALSDALLAPLAARQELRARTAALQTAQNDSLLAVAEAYFNVQQARGELAGAEDVARRAAEVVRRAESLYRNAQVIPELEVVRARTERALSSETVSVPLTVLASRSPAPCSRCTSPLTVLTCSRAG